MFQKNYPKKLDSFKKQVQDKLEKAFAPIPLPMSLNAGKQIRSELVFLVGSICDVKESVLEEMAFCVEGIHTASLFIDDVIDEDESRRGKPSLHMMSGEKNAINFSFLLVSKILQRANRFFPAQLPLIIKTFQKMATGELKSATPENYISICHLKTGTLFTLSVLLPALYAKLPYEDAKKLMAFGKNFGILYQLKDDKKDGDGILSDEELDMVIEVYERKLNESIVFTDIKLKNALSSYFSNEL